MLSEGSHSKVGKDPGFAPAKGSVNLRAAPRTVKSLPLTHQGCPEQMDKPELDTPRQSRGALPQSELHALALQLQNPGG